MNSFVSKSLNDLPEIAAQLIRLGKERSVWIFVGDLGAGKTTLIKHICQQLGVKDPVVSPTFGLVNTYQGASQRIHHFDWYRIKQEGEALEIGWEEYLDSGDLLLVEWPEKIENLLPEELMGVQIYHKESGMREIVVHVF